MGILSTEDRRQRLQATSESRDLTKQIPRWQVQSHRDWSQLTDKQ
jgi:anti-sigma-K factor RskA